MSLELPLICDKKGEWIKINQNNFTQLKFTLYDFMRQPVIIYAPIHIKLELKIKSINSNTIIHTLSKYYGHPKASHPSNT
jgi:hypothetical protein